MTILYIDDDEEDREVFGEALRIVDESIVYSYAPNGREALQYLVDQEQLPDFIFLDILMPVMSGGEFITEIKKDTRLSNIRIVLCTTYLTPQAYIEFKALGIIDILIKPHSFDELIKSLYLILK